MTMHLQLSPLESLARLERLRRSVFSDPTVDAFVIIGGVDSCDDGANNQLVNYLLVGGSDEITEYDDTFIVLHRSGVRLYTTPPVAHRVCRVVALWPHLHVDLLPPRHFEDQGRFETHKMVTFREAITPFKTLAMTWSGDATDAIKVVERWPLVQSYAVDDLGQRPFLTMAKKVVKAAAIAPVVACVHDSFWLVSFVAEQCRLIVQQFEATLTWADASVQSLVPNIASAPQVAEDLGMTLRLFYDHCKIAAKDVLVAQPPETVVKFLDDDAIVALRFTDPEDRVTVRRTVCIVRAYEGGRVVAKVQAVARGFEKAAKDAMARVGATGGDDAALLGAFRDALARQRVNGEASVRRNAAGFAVLGVATPDGIEHSDTYASAGRAVARLTASVVDTDAICIGTDANGRLSTLRRIADTRSADDAAGFGKVLLDATRGDGCAVVVDAGRLAEGSNATVAFHADGLSAAHKRYGVLGLVRLADLTVHNPSDTEAPVAVSWRLPSDSWGAGMDVAVLLRPSCGTRRDFLSTVLPQWRAAGVAMTDVPPTIGPKDPFPPRTSSDLLSVAFGHGKIADEDPESEPIRRDRELRLATDAVTPGLLSVAAACLYTPAASDETDIPSLGVDVHLISGTLGAGKHKVAARVLRTMQSLAAEKRDASSSSGGRVLVRDYAAPFGDTDATAGAHGHDATAMFDPEDVLQFLAALDAAARRDKARGVAVVTVPPQAALPHVWALCAKVGPHVRVCSSTAVVNIDTFYDNHGLQPPAHPGTGALRCLVPGFVDTLFVTSSQRNSPVSIARVERAVRQSFSSLLRPETGAAPTPLLSFKHMGVVYSAEDVVSRVFIAQTQQAQLHVAPYTDARATMLAVAGSLYEPDTCAAALHFEPHHLALRFKSMPLIEPNVHDFMARIADPAEDSPLAGVVRVRGSLNVDGQQLELLAVRGKPYLNRLRARGATDTVRTEQIFHFFIEGDYDAHDFERHLMRHVAYRGSLVGDDTTLVPTAGSTKRFRKRPHVTRDILTSSDVARILESSEDVELPSGWSYDGNVYRNRTTNATASTRPDVDACIDAFLQRRNAAIDAYNATLPTAAAA